MTNVLSICQLPLHTRLWEADDRQAPRKMSLERNGRNQEKEVTQRFPADDRWQRTTSASACLSQWASVHSCFTHIVLSSRGAWRNMRKPADDKHTFSNKDWFIRLLSLQDLAVWLLHSGTQSGKVEIENTQKPHYQAPQVNTFSHTRCCHGNVRNDHLCDARDGSSVNNETGIRQEEEEKRCFQQRKLIGLNQFPLSTQIVLWLL